MQKIINLSPEHISVYNLNVVRGTKLYNDFLNGKVPDVIDINQEIEMREITKSLLFDSGYVMNTLDEFSKPGYENQYSKYSRLGNTFSFGSGSYGILNDYMYYHLDDIDEYFSMIEKNVIPVKVGLSLSGIERMNRYLAMLPYYLKLEKDDFYKLFGISLFDLFSDEIKRLKNNELIEENDSSIRLTTKGEVFAPTISQYFYSNKQKIRFEQFNHFLYSD